MAKKKETKSLPSKVITLEIGENSYEVKYPNNGQLIDIESLKITLSKGNLDGMLFARTPGSQLAFFTVEMISTFTILIPQLMKDIKVDSLLDLDPIETKGLIKVYQSQYYPWYKEWYDYINEDFIVEDEDEPVEEESESK